MTKFWQIYYNMVLGALGGLLAWLVIGLIATSAWPVHAANAFVGAGIGAILGAVLGSADGIIIKRSAQRAGLGALSGGLVGMAGGALGLLLGGLLFVLLQGGLIPRMLGWMLMGLALGLGHSILSRQARRSSYSLVGGTLAGLAGGALFELLTQAFLENSGEAQVYLGALGLVLIGACLGSIIPLTLEIAREGRIVVLTGRRADMVISVIGATVIGASDACEVFIPASMVAPKQAVVTRAPGGFTIENIGDRAFLVNQASLNPHQSSPLPDRAMIQMGSTQLQFNAR